MLFLLFLIKDPSLKDMPLLVRECFMWKQLKLHGGFHLFKMVFACSLFFYDIISPLLLNECWLKNFGDPIMHLEIKQVVNVLR